MSLLDQLFVVPPKDVPFKKAERDLTPERVLKALSRTRKYSLNQLALKLGCTQKALREVILPLINTDKVWSVKTIHPQSKLVTIWYALGDGK
jgi:hypothetical protein